MKSIMKHLIATILMFSMLNARAEWTPLPQLSASGQYYNVLLHLGADFYNEYLYTAGIDLDQLSGFGGQSNQMPYPGLTYSGLTGPGSGQTCNLTWTIITNTAANYGIWTTGVPSNTNGKDNYIKYWHININAPGDEDRDARIYFRCDDDLRIWRNGDLIVKSGYISSDMFSNITLRAGINSFTVKLREGTGGDNMGFRITDSVGVPFSDLTYSLNFKILAPPAAPLLIARSHESITFAPNFVNNSDKAFDLWAVCDSEERGGELSDWTNSPTCSFQTFSNIFAPPASIEFSGLPHATTHAIRLFATNDGESWETSLTLNISTYDVLADITSLEVSDIAGLDATANARINSYGPNENAADVYLYYWKDGAAVTNTASKSGQSIGPVDIGMAGLAYSTDYRYRFAVSNANGFAWSANTIAFKTLGDPKLGAPTAAMAGGGIVDMSVAIIEPGAGAISATCYWGDSRGNMQPIKTWADITGLSELSAQISGVNIGYPYSYAFEINAFVDPNTHWTVGVTNDFTTTGACVWTAGGATTDWFDADNWDLGLPGPAGTAEFANIDDSPITVTASDYVFIDAINVRSGASEVIFDLDTALLKAENITTTINNTKLTLASGRLEVFNFTVGRHSSAAQASYNEVVLEPGSHLKVANLVVGYCTAGGGPIDTRVTVRPGAVLKADANTIITRRDVDQNSYGNELLIQGLFLANGIRISSNRGGPGYFTVDGGVVTNTSATSLDGGDNQWLTLRNNARFTQTQGDLTIGVAASQVRLQVLDGSVFEHTGNVKMNDRTDNPGNTAWLIVSNATFRATGGNNVGHRGISSGSNPVAAGYGNSILVYEDPGHETLVSFGGNVHFRSSRDNVLAINGGAFESATLACATENGAELLNSYSNKFHIAGASTRLRPASLSLRNNALLSFTIPEEGFDDIPVVITGAVSLNNEPLYPTANDPRDDNTRLEINAENFLGRATLLTASTGNLDLVRKENITVKLRPGRKHNLRLTPQSIAIDVWTEGTLIFIK